VLRVLILTLFLIAVGAVHADDLASPSATQLREAFKASTAAIEAARQSPPTTDAGRSVAGALDATQPAQRTGAVPHLDTAANATADVRALLERARTGTVLGTQPASVSSAEASPLVFVSFSLPEASLRTLIAQSRSIGAALVLRGLLDDSMQRTVERLGQLLGGDDDAPGNQRPGPEPNLMIDPTLFERFDVTTVPSFVLPTKTPASCEPAGPCATPEHVKLAGDVGLEYALEVMSREASDPRARATAAHWIRKAQGAE
jgi:type-F conjugative transfer system pilin assembly protein TrbC